MRIAVVEPYLGGSHASWARGYQDHSAHDVVLMAHADRFWKWRMHGSHVTLAREFEAAVASGGQFDAVVGSSMLNGAGFLGLARRSLESGRFVLFMHENQLGYPLSPRDKPDLTYPMINWTSMVAADLVIFNSDYHRSQWFTALPGFLHQFPDYRQQAMIGAVEAKSVVAPVGIDLGRLDRSQRKMHDLPRILWNQRWEYDKGLAELAQAMIRLAELGVEFELIIAGEQPPTDPVELTQLHKALADRIVHFGWADSDRYVELLVSSDIVVSTAHHEFFGISITEAVYAGAFPVLPNRLVYPERIPPRFHDVCLFDGEADLVARLVWATSHVAEARAIALELKPVMAAAAWPRVAPRYDDLILDS
jgi:glycosyltransferase involved in cell wall biosynthesis